MARGQSRASGASVVEDYLEDYLEDLPIPNKYFLMKTLKQGRSHTRKYYHEILASFKSTDFIHNLLLLLGNFGFLNFFFEASLLDSYIESYRTGASVVDSYMVQQREDFWWPGYSPYDIDNRVTYDFNAYFNAIDDMRYQGLLSCF